MPLLAETFWKAPNVYDLAGVAGLFIGIASIWLSWWLAKRDIDKRLEKAAERAERAARDEVRRVARALLQGGLANAIRFLELSREAARGRQWLRATDLANLAREQLARVLAQPGLEAGVVPEVHGAVANLQTSMTALGGQTRSGAGELGQDAQQVLNDAILTLHRAEAQTAAIRLE